VTFAVTLLRMDTGETKTDVRRAVLAVTITSFSLAALMGIAALLGSDFGETSARILLTTVVVGCASVVTLACLVPVETRWMPVSVTGFLVALGTAAFSLMLVWMESDWGEGAFQTLGIGVTLSLTLAQVCLLLGVTVRRPSISVLVWITIGLAAVLAGQVIFLILGDDVGDGFYKLVGVVAILDVLGTLVSIALGVFGRGGQTSSVPVTAALSARLQTRAAETGRPVAELVDEAVERYLDETSVGWDRGAYGERTHVGSDPGVDQGRE
jgi:hypothetical protein